MTIQTKARPAFQNFTLCWLLSIPFILLPTAALANVPFFLVFASVRFFLWWIIPLAIVIEAGALWYIFDLSPRRALLSATLINVGTAVLGYFIYPFVGFMSYPVLAPLVVSVFGASSNVEVVAVTVAAAVIDTPVELALLALLSAGLGYGIKIGWKAASLFFIANLVSASILFAALQIDFRGSEMDPSDIQTFEAYYEEELEFVRTLQQKASKVPHPAKKEEIDRWINEQRREISKNSLRFVEVTANRGHFPTIYSHPDFQFDPQKTPAAKQRSEGVYIGRGFLHDGLLEHPVPIWRYLLLKPPTVDAIFLDPVYAENPAEKKN